MHSFCKSKHSRQRFPSGISFIFSFALQSACARLEKCVCFSDFGSFHTFERTLRILRSTPLPLIPQNLSLTGLVVIIIVTEAIISSHSWQGICKAIWFVHLLTQLYHHHLPILQGILSVRMQCSLDLSFSDILYSIYENEKPP